MTATAEQISMASLSSERVDIRRNKKYGIRLSIYMTLGDDKLCKGCLPSGVAVRLWDICEDLPHCKPGAYYGRDEQHDCEDCGRKFQQHVTGLRLTFWVGADRPKEILSESRAQKLIAGKCVENADKTDHLSLEEILRDRMLAHLIVVEIEVQKARIAEQASQLVGHLRMEADKQARENIDWENRLAALKAELVLQQKHVLETLVAGEFQQGCEDSEQEWNPRAIELAIEKAAEHLPSPISSGFRSTSMTPSVTSEDV